MKGSDKGGMRRRDANTRATREAIIAAARDTFARDGFAGAALEDIVTSAGVTTGALYHHFGNKRGLFRAVAESLEQEILNDVVAGLSADASSWEQVEYGIARSLELCAQRDVQRILFSDAPNVIGIREWREIELRYGFGLMRQLLSQLAEGGQLRHESVDLNAQILLGALIEAAHAVAASDEPARALAEAKGTLLLFLASLRP